MAKYTRMQVLATMKTIGVIPVFYNADFGTAKAILDACVDGGARCIEFTNRGDRAIEIFTRLAEYRDEQRNDAILGVGSVCDAPTAGQYISAGADFVVGPLLDEGAAKLCNQRKIPYSPGCATATEIHKAHELGVEICKIFPGTQVGGPGFVKALKGPCPWVDLMPTGGVAPTRENLEEWFKAGICCAGMGSKLISKDLVAKSDWESLRQKIKDTVDIIKDIRNAIG